MFPDSSRAFASIRAAPRSLVGFEPMFSIVPGQSRPVGSSRGLRSSAVAGSVGKLVVVESPAKATSVQKYLGDGYTVLASYGHVRDLVQKNGGVKPEDDFAMLWAEKARDGVVRDIVKNAKGAAELLLATDPTEKVRPYPGTSSSCSARRGAGVLLIPPREAGHVHGGDEEGCAGGV